MKNTQEIEVYISGDGELKIHIKGIKGPSCTKVLDELVKDIGEVTGKEATAEYYEKPQTGNTTNISNR